MKSFVDIVIETINPTGALNRLHSLGLEKGNGLLLFATPLESVAGPFYVTFRVWEDRVHVIPKNNNPTFTIKWRSDEFDEDGNLYPWPQINLDGTVIQGARVIS